jgi:hypothetical protein
MSSSARVITVSSVGGRRFATAGLRDAVVLLRALGSDLDSSVPRCAVLAFVPVDFFARVAAMFTSCSGYLSRLRA